MVKNSEGKKSIKSEEKKDTESERFLISDELTRRPLDRCREKPKESQLYPTKALLEDETEDEISEEEISEEEIDDIWDEETDYVETDNIENQSCNITLNVIYKEEGKELRNRKPLNRKPRNRRSSTNSQKKSNKVIQKPKLQHQSKNISLKQFSFYGLLVIVSGIVLYFMYASFTQSTTSTSTLDINAIISSLKPEFEKQPEMSFRVIRTALKAVYKTEPTAPAIILLLAAQGAENQSRDLGIKLVKAISPHFLNISGAAYKNLNSDDGKKKIDDLLHSLSENEYDAVLVEDLHLIPGGTALMFHTYCDHENAPYKRTVYVMTVDSGIVIPSNSTNKFWEETIQDRLTRSWSDIKDDQMAPLLARLTVGVAAITAGN